MHVIDYCGTVIGYIHLEKTIKILLQPVTGYQQLITIEIKPLSNQLYSIFGRLHLYIVFNLLFVSHCNYVYIPFKYVINR